MDYKDLERVNAEITTTSIKGKDYAEVPSRVTAFRKLYPEGSITTELISCENGVCVFKATAMNGDIVLGTGHAYEKEGSTFINKTSYIENCETSAVGRALGFVGIGIDTSIASAEEVQNAKANQNTDDSGYMAAELYREIERLANEKKVSLIDICSRAKVSFIRDMPVSQAKSCLKWLKEQ